MTTITDRLMSSTSTPHTARRVQLAPERWRASWLPARVLSRNQAITAITIAELATEGLTAGGLRPDSPAWPLINQLAAELDLTGIDAAWQVANPPHVLDRRLHTLTTSCWCEPATALDGHRESDGTEPEFAATDQDPVDADGYLIGALS